MESKIFKLFEDIPVSVILAGGFLLTMWIVFFVMSFEVTFWISVVVIGIASIFRVLIHLLDE